eukprot:3133855-Heterocapsa_arctica.AAC.1
MIIYNIGCPTLWPAGWLTGRLADWPVGGQARRLAKAIRHDRLSTILSGTMDPEGEALKYL